MADLERSVRVMLLGEDYNLDKTMRNASRDFDKFSQNVQDATQPLADFGKRVAMTEAALVSMVAGGLAYASKQAADFDSSFREITTLMDDTGQSVDRFRGDILEYAQTSTKSVEDINNALYNAISAGVDYKDAIGSLSQAEELAVATKSNLNDATTTLVSTLNSYGASSDEAGEYAEILFETVKNGQTTMDQLSGKLANVTSIAANSGVSFDELSAAIAATTESGIRTEQSITGLRETISNIIKPTSQAKDMAEELGINFNAQALEAEGLSGILDDVREATGGNTEQMAQLFGSVEALNTVMALTGEGAEKFSETLEATEKHTGSLSDAYSKMADDVKLQAQTLINTIETTMIGVGDRVLAGLEGVPEAASRVFAGIGDAIDEGAFDDVFEAIDRFGDNFRDTLLDIAENVPEALGRLEFDDLIASFGTLGESIEEALDALMGDELDLSTVEGLEKAGQRLIDIFTGLTNFTAGFVDGMRPMVRVIGELAEGAANADEKAQELAGRISGLAQTANTGMQALDGIKNALWAIAGVTGIRAVASTIGGLGSAAAGAIGSASALTGLAGLGAILAGGAAAGAVGYGAFKAGEALGELVFPMEDVGKEARMTAEEVKQLESDIRDLKDMSDDVDRMIMELEAEPLTKSDWDGIAAETHKQFQEAGLDTSVLSFDIDADTDNATKKIEDLPPKIEKLDPPDFEVPVKIQEAEIEKEIAELESQAEVAQAAFEYRAKVETAEIEKFQTALEEAGATARDAKQATTDMVDVWAGGVEGPFENLKRSKLWSLIEERMDMEKESHRMQQEMNKEQLRMMELRREQMAEGESAMNITIDDSVEPALRLVMMNILELMQTELNQYADQFLVGINSVTQ